MNSLKNYLANLVRNVRGISSIFRQRGQVAEEILVETTWKLYRKHSDEIIIILGIEDMPKITITVENQIDFPAATSGTELILNQKYFQGKKDEGAIIHEFAHLFQRCPRYDKETSWLIEGIGDYVRDVLGYVEEWSNPHYEQGMALKGYQTTAHFLIWLENFHLGGVKELSRCLVKDTYSADSFHEIFGYTLEELVQTYEEKFSITV